MATSTKYKLVYSYTPETLEELVNEAIQESYSPHGSLTLDTHGRLVQPMMRL